MTVGERVKTIRKEYGLTMDRFGKRLGITKAGISRIESGVTNLTPQMAKSIAREFGISEEWLKTGEGEMRPATASGAAAEIAGRLGLGPWATQALERFMDLKENEQILFLDILEKILDPSERQADALLDAESEAIIKAAGEEAMRRKRAELLDKLKAEDA